MNGARIGHGLDVHAFSDDPARPLILCGVRIDDAPGLAGHSDADAGCHAVADALLGAAAMGDLGTWFGTDLAEHADADSTALLATVWQRVTGAGYELGNLHLTLLAQRPRLARHREPMRERLAEVLGVPVAQVAVSFTTTDGLGAIGRGEGIAADATCLLLVAHR